MARYIIIVVWFFAFSGIAFAQRCHRTESMSKHIQESTTLETKPGPLQVQSKCSVMGNGVDRAIYTIWDGDENHTPKKVYFCCSMCIDKFKTNPNKYIKKLEKMKQPIENAGNLKNVWICTMDPGIRSDKPGNCPQCGIALVKE